MSMSNTFVAIDPGASGSMCLLSYDGKSIEFIDFKSNGVKGYADRLRDCSESLIMCCVESVSSMPGQGVKSMFSFGQRLGEIEGMFITLGIGYVMPKPQEWRKACGVPPKADKNGIFETISKIYPQADLRGPKGGLLDGRCDALSMAHYLRKTYSF